MKRGVYLASSWAIKALTHARRNELIASGVPVNSTWTLQQDKNGHELSESEMRKTAASDTKEARASELVLVDMTVKSSTGGWVTEMGICLGAGSTLWVIGDRSRETNIFARLADRWFDSYEDARAALLDLHARRN